MPHVTASELIERANAMLPDPLSEADGLTAINEALEKLGDFALEQDSFRVDSPADATWHELPSNVTSLLGVRVVQYYRWGEPWGRNWGDKGFPLTRGYQREGNEILLERAGEYMIYYRHPPMPLGALDRNHVEIMHLEIAEATGGTFRLGKGEDETEDLAYGISATDLALAINGLDGIEGATVTSESPELYVITQTYQQRQSGLEVADNSLTSDTEATIELDMEQEWRRGTVEVHESFYPVIVTYMRAWAFIAEDEESWKGHELLQRFDAEVQRTTSTLIRQDTPLRVRVRR